MALFTPRHGPHGMTLVADLVLTGACSARALELTLDSLLGQTEGRFRVRVPPEAGEGSAPALLGRYGDPRLLAGEEAGEDAPYVAGIEAGMVLAPTWLARLAAMLDADPHAGAARCGVSHFDGAVLRPAPRGGDGKCRAAPAGRRGVHYHRQ